MKTFGLTTVAAAAMAVGTLMAQGAAAPAAPPAPAAPQGAARGPAAPGLTLTTQAFPDGGIIPPKHTQMDPSPVSPKLEWTNVPAGVVTFALIMHDLDVAPARSSEDNLHWMAFNIPGTARELAEGVPAGAQLPDGTIQGKTRTANGFMGPGAGAAGPLHHYVFELYALDIKLDLTADATRADLLKAMVGHVVGKASVFGRFKRS